MFKKGYTMNDKTSRSVAKIPTPVDLITAVEDFVANGGMIAVIPDGETAEFPGIPVEPLIGETDTYVEKIAKIELLRSLAAKGAGVSALQYSLRMNKRDIRQLAIENGVKIISSRPVSQIRREHRHDPTEVDDAVAGHAMHYSSLGYTAPEIAQVLGLSLRQVWDIGKAYRFEFKQQRVVDCAPPDC